MTPHLFFFIAAMVCMIGVVGSFLWGIVAMTKGKKEDHPVSNKMMQSRILLQGLAILFLFLSFVAK